MLLDGCNILIKILMTTIKHEQISSFLWSMIKNFVWKSLSLHLYFSSKSLRYSSLNHLLTRCWSQFFMKPLGKKIICVQTSAFNCLLVIVLLDMRLVIYVPFDKNQNNNTWFMLIVSCFWPTHFVTKYSGNNHSKSTCW